MTRHALAEIAHDPSVGARSRLLHSLGELVFSDRQPTADEINELCAVAKILLKVADDASRSHFATLAAASKLLPRDMVFLLLQDKVVVAGPVLKSSPVLTEADLTAFAETLGDERLLFIAQRDKLGANLVEIVVERGGELVQVAIAENVGAELSDVALRHLIHSAEASEPLCRSLVRRPEVPKADAEHLVRLITRMLQARMKASATPEPAPVPASALVEAASKAQSAKIDVSELLAAIKAGTLNVGAAITQLSDDDRFNDLTVLISGLTRVDDVSVMRLLVRADANGIAMMLKALNLSDQAFASVVALRRRRLKTSEAQARYEREDYAKLTVAECKATLLQLASSRQGR